MYILGFPIKKDTKTRLTDLEKEVSTLNDKLKKLSEEYSNRINLLEKMVVNNIDIINSTVDEIDDIWQDIENLENRICEFYIPEENDFSMSSVDTKLEYIIKLLEKYIDCD